ncbi:MAG: winged helix-turn-helix domain-containing protein [Candidatus Dormibacteria bacterium]
MSSELAECLETFRRWLYLPDVGHVCVALATVAANRGSGDPVWTVFVAGPSGGKTEVIVAFDSQPDVHLAALMTEGGLLSATPKKERASTASGGLLREVGDFGILALKDLGTVLSMNRDTRSALMAALREIYDGGWVRHVGTDGGRTLEWTGKLGLIAGCTSAIDTHSAVMAALGERFLLYRLPDPDERQQGRQALAQAGHESAMREELGAAVDLVLGAVDLNLLGAPPSVGDADRLVDLASLAVRCRSAVERDSYSREVELVHAREAPGRLAKVLLQLLRALRAIGVDEATAWALTAKCGMDCIPPTRLQALRALVEGGERDTAGLASELGYPTNTLRRSLEDLAAHGVVGRTKTGNRDLWNATDWARELWPAGVPEISAVPEKSAKVCKGPFSSPYTSTDFSGTHFNRSGLAQVPAGTAPQPFADVPADVAAGTEPPADYLPMEALEQGSEPEEVEA